MTINRYNAEESGTHIPFSFEDDYLVRTLNSSITSQADIALTELVANAWDAGATKVSVFIPDEYGDLLVIEDNGNGLTAEEFQERWMTLGYNKLLRQGKQVLFPDNKKRSPRIAYGRNGIGRHSLLCFNDEYHVITSKMGKNFLLLYRLKYKDKLSLSLTKIFLHLQSMAQG